MDSEHPTYSQEFSPWLRLYLCLMIFCSSVIIIYNVFVGARHTDFGIVLLCVALRIIINVTDILALSMLLRRKSIGLWICVSTAFFSVLLSIVLPDYMSPFVRFLNVTVILGLLALLFVSHNGVNGYQILGIARINGRYIDEWVTGKKRYM